MRCVIVGIHIGCFYIGRILIKFVVKTMFHHRHGMNDIIGKSTKNRAFQHIFQQHSASAREMFGNRHIIRIDEQKLVEIFFFHIAGLYDDGA